MSGVVRIGTRGSPLARAQTELACRALREADPGLAEPGALEIVVIRTTGDRTVDRPLAELGGKGLFCKELEAALLEHRIDLAVHSMKDLPTWLPAVGQGAIGIECGAEDPIRMLLNFADHAPTRMCITAERAMLEVLDGSCHTPIAGHARIEHGRMRLRGLIVRPDGSQAHGTEHVAQPSDAERLGREVGQELRARAGPGFFD